MLEKLIVCIVAGLGAGIGTGLRECPLLPLFHPCS